MRFLLEDFLKNYKPTLPNYSTKYRGDIRIGHDYTAKVFFAGYSRPAPKTIITITDEDE